MSEPVKKRVDESWKEQAEREKQVVSGPGAPAGAAQAPSGPAAPPQVERAPEEHDHAREAGGRDAGPEAFEARFDLFVSSLAMEALIALGDMAHPVTRKQQTNPGQAKYLIDLLGILEGKTKGNLTVDEEKLLKDALYQLRMRYLAKTTK